MGLLNNGYRHSLTGRLFGATALDGCNASMLRSFLKPAYQRNQVASEGIADDLAGVPNGYRHPGAWVMPRKPGAMSSRNEITGEGTMAGNAWAVKLAEAMLTGSGELTAFGGLVVQLIASISGSGTISNADMKAFLQALASIGGTGSATGTMTAFGELLAELLGAGTAGESTLTGIGELEAVIRGYGDLTPEGLRDAVWNAIAANYGTTGTMGELLNSAGAAADPLLGVVEGTMTLRDVQRIVLAVLAGQVTGAGTGTETFKGQAGEDRVVSVVDNDGNRSSVTLDAS